MTSVERVLEYCDLEAEAPPVTETRPPSDWPPSGSIVFKDMSLKYAPHLKNVLHHISCHVRANEKVNVQYCILFFRGWPSLTFCPGIQWTIVLGACISVRVQSIPITF